MELRYLYVGSADTAADVAAWLAIPKARLRWRFRRFGADVAAIDLGSRPVVLLTDHRPPGTVLPIYAVDDLELSIGYLGDRWMVEAGPLGTPEGPACVLRNDSGTTIALLRVDRADALDAAWTTGNPHAVDPPSAGG